MIRDLYDCIWDDKDIMKEVREGKRKDLKLIVDHGTWMRCEVINSNK